MKKDKGKGKEVVLESSQDIITRLTEELQAQSLVRINLSHIAFITFTSTRSFSKNTMMRFVRFKTI